MKVAQLCPALCDPIDYTVHGILQARILEWVAFPFSRGSSQPGIEPGSPTLQADSLPAEPQGKPKNTGVGSLSLLEGIFLTQESNWGLSLPQVVVKMAIGTSSLVSCLVGVYKKISINVLPENKNKTFFILKSQLDLPSFFIILSHLQSSLLILGIECSGDLSLY